MIARMPGTRALIRPRLGEAIIDSFAAGTRYVLKERG